MKAAVAVLVVSMVAAPTANAATVNSIDVRAKEDSTAAIPPGGATGVFLNESDPFSVAATGTWSLDGSNFIGPEGTGIYGAQTCDPFILCGALVGQIGTSGPVFFVGPDFSGDAGASGELFLRALDNDFLNNTGTIRAEITTHPNGPDGVIPLPAAGWLLLGGLGGLAALRRRRS